MKIRLFSATAMAVACVVAAPMTAAASGPVSGSPVLTVPASQSEVANQAVVESLYRAFAAGDGATISGLLAEDLVWVEAEGGPYADRNPYNGPGAVFEGVFGRIGAAFEGFVVTPVTFVASGDRVVAMGRYTGTNRATGESLAAQFAHVFTVTNGKISHFQQYTDTAQWVDVVTPD